MLFIPFPEDERLERVKTTLSNHMYEYLRPIGRGGFASVHLVHSIRYNQEFAAKLIDINNINNRSEINTLMQLNGPNVIKMYETFEDDTYLYIILEYCEGGSFADFIREHGPLPREKLYRVCAKLIETLQQCHEKKIAHRDIKPANVLIDAWGRPKLADFGLAQFYSDDREGINFSGSKPYMSPELIMKTEYNPFAADVWALGITFYFFAYGRLPWSYADRKELENQVVMGMINYPYEPTYESNFIQCLRGMTSVHPKNRVTLKFLLQQDFLKSVTHNGNVPSSSSSVLVSFGKISASSSISECVKEQYSIQRSGTAKILKQFSQSMKPMKPIINQHTFRSLPNTYGSKKRTINFLLKSIAGHEPEIAIPEVTRPNLVVCF